MKRYTRSMVVGLAIVFAAGCGSEGEQGEQGPPGEAPEVTTERIEDHDDCPAGGVDIIADGEVLDTVCDGEDGVGESPDVETERDDDHPECEGGGVDIIVDGDVTDVICDGEPGTAPEIAIDDEPDECGDAGGVTVSIGDDDFTVCNGEDGTGEGEVPEITIGEPDDCGDAGGYSLEIGDEDPIDICHGEDGADGGEGGEGGTDIEIEELEASETGPCVEGGLEITVTDSDGSEETFQICGVAPIDPPEIGWCGTTYPESVDKFDDETVTVFGQVYVQDFTGDQAGTLPDDDYNAELGYVEAAADPDDDVDPTDDDWTWLEAELNEDFDFEPNNDEFEADFSEFDAGEYYYLYRMTVDGGDEWVYCGLEGDFEPTEYDASEDAGFMDVTAAPTGIAGWTFEGENLDASHGEDTDAYAQFSDPDADENFFGDYEWTVNNAWIESEEFPPDDYDELGGFDEFDDLNYYEFNSEMFGDFDEVVMDTHFSRSNAGPRQVQVVAVFDDGTLAMLNEAVEIDGDATIDVSADVLEPLDDDPASDAEIESYRIYGFEANNTGFQSGNMRVHFMDFLGY